ncbi:ABC transporter ATP-binding protein [Craterilacuibacter sp.]|uniref:ABC transporter ATP-binding protein n=1 Tax=Craterilacuibacter sp. TaxID=2870909 RepID=UPI003F3A144F
MLSTRELSLQIGPLLLLDSLDWQVAPGQIWAIIGRNGAGKSTLLRTLVGLQAPTSGHIQLDGRELSVWQAGERARRMSYLPQGRSDAFGYRVLDAVLAARHPHQQNYWESATDLEIARDALSELDIGHLAQRDIRTLSGGERQRAAIAGLLAQDAPLMLLDEPASALDLAHQITLLQLVSRLTQEQGKAVVMVSHELNLTLQHASHALLLLDNGLWQAGAVAELTAADLGRCLGYPLQAIVHEGQTLYIPQTRRIP